MAELRYFQNDESNELLRMVLKLWRKLRYSDITTDDVKQLHSIIASGVEHGVYKRDKYGINPVIRTLHTAELVADNIAPDRNMTIAVLIYNLCRNGHITEKQISDWFGDDVAKLVHGLIKISQLYKKQAAVEDENFRKLLVLAQSPAPPCNPNGRLDFKANKRQEIIMLQDNQLKKGE